MSAFPSITASMLYDHVQCPTRVHHDLHGDQSQRDPISAFVRMLWERGALHEDEVVQGLKVGYEDLSRLSDSERERLTLDAMRMGTDLIYGGRVAADGLIGIPDLLRRIGDRYVPIDIKSGRGEEAGGDDEDGKPKLHYAVQLALYVDILQRLGLSAGRFAYVLDVRGAEVRYDLDSARGPRSPGSLWDEYETHLAEARRVVVGEVIPLGALSSSCKLCHWYTRCKSDLLASDDLTRIPQLGRSLRDVLVAELPTVAALAAADPEAYAIKGKTVFRGLGLDRLRTFHARAKLLTESGARPYLKNTVTLPYSEIELFFDIEVDPLRDLTYLHGILERRGGRESSETFFGYFAEDETPAAERDAFARSFEHLSRYREATIWYYSKYERTLYRKLQNRYPEVCTPEEIEGLFDPARAVDLYYDVVLKATEWPTHDHSIKTLASYLGFSWRDTNPSGAASIEWFDRWVREREPTLKQRILDYNEDDCRATRVLLDGIRGMAG